MFCVSVGTIGSLNKSAAEYWNDAPDIKATFLEKARRIMNPNPPTNDEQSDPSPMIATTSYNTVNIIYKFSLTSVQLPNGSAA